MIRSRVIYRAGQLPVFQNRVYDTPTQAAASPQGDMVLVQDIKTGLVFNQAFQPELLHYGPDYQNEQSYSSVFQAHLEQVESIIRRHFWGKSLIEVGCGKGHFLRILKQKGYTVTGLDPAYEGNDPDIIKAPFQKELGIAGEGIVLRHVLEHIPDPVGFLFSLREANGGGTIYIEVPCFDWICRHRAWYDIYYEHVNYFRLPDLRRMFQVVHDAGSFFGGQYIYLVADLATARSPECSKADYAVFPRDFFARIHNLANRLKIARRNQAANAPSVVWGASSKGVIFSLFMQRLGVSLDFAVDINPLKQGKYLPGSGLYVMSPEEASRSLAPGSDVFVVNSNYLEEIKTLSRNQYNYIAVEDANLSR